MSGTAQKNAQKEEKTAQKITQKEDMVVGRTKPARQAFADLRDIYEYIAFELLSSSDGIKTYEKQ